MPVRILIIRMSALGDIVHALPLLAAIRRAHPEAHIGWLCEPAGKALLERHPMIDRLHILPRKAWRQSKLKALRGPMRQLVHQLRRERYDIALDVQGLTKSAIWPWLARVPRRLVLARPDSREAAPWLATETVALRADDLHVIQRNLALLQPLNINRPDPPDFPIFIPPETHQDARRLLQLDLRDASSPRPPLVVMNPGAGWPTKIWPPKRFGRLARILFDRFGASILFAWGPGEEPLVREALTEARGRHVVDFGIDAIPLRAGMYPLPATGFAMLAAIVSHAHLFVGGDTGPTHLAAALGVPTVCMMGPLDARRNSPFGPHCLTVQHGVPRTPPFWANHRRWCDPKTSLQKVTIEDVLQPCVKMFNRALSHA